MAKFVLGVLCQNAVVDKFTNNLTIINQIDQLNIPPFVPNAPKRRRAQEGPPVINLPLMFVGVWERDDLRISEFEHCRGTLIGPQRQRLATFEFDINLKNTLRSRFIGNIGALAFVGSGVYRLTLHLRRGRSWKKTGEVSLHVQQIGKNLKLN